MNINNLNLRAEKQEHPILLKKRAYNPNDIYSLGNVITTLYQEYKNREKVKNIIGLFFKKEVIEQAKKLCKKEDLVDAIIDRCIIKETK